MSAPTYELVGGPFHGQHVATYRDLPLLRVLCRRDRLYVGQYTAAPGSTERVLTYGELSINGGAA